jgi:hypothetical protein
MRASGYTARCNEMPSRVQRLRRVRHRAGPRASARAAVLGIAACLGAAGSAPGADDGPTPLYRWTDRHGVTRYTPTKAHIPSAERDGAIPVEPTRATAPALESTGALADGGATPEPAAPPDPVEQPPSLPVGSGSAEEGGYAVQIDETPVSEGVPPLPLLGVPSGLRVYQIRAEQRGDAWTRTRVGPFPTRAKARVMLELLGPRFPGASIVAVADPAADPPAAPIPPYRYVIQLRASVKSATPAPLPRVDLPDGLRLFRTSFEKNGVVWERTRVGFFPTREAAETMRRRLEPRFPGAWIDRVPAAERVAAAATAGAVRP